jgi:hypothetical protein
MHDLPRGSCAHLPIGLALLVISGLLLDLVDIGDTTTKTTTFNSHQDKYLLLL